MSGPWIKSYPNGVRWDAELETMPLAQILERSAAKWPTNPALDFMNRKFSYLELSDLTNQAAKGFQKLGVRPGVHVGLYLPNTPHYIIAFFGVMKAGGTVVNYSPLDAEKVLEHKVEDSETDIRDARPEGTLPSNPAARNDTIENPCRRQHTGNDAST
jgi:long-chain acyl-CoA synthetase